MTKRRHAYLIIAAMGLGLTGCGINKEADTMSEATTEAIVVTEAEPITESTTEQVDMTVNEKDNKLTATASDSAPKDYVSGLDDESRNDELTAVAKSVEKELGTDTEIVLTIPVDYEDIEKEDVEYSFYLIGKYLLLGLKKDGDALKTTGSFTGIAKMEKTLKSSSESEYDITSLTWAKKDSLESDVEAMCEGHDGLSDRMISADEKDEEIYENAFKTISAYLKDKNMKDIKTIDLDGNEFVFDIDADISSGEADSYSDEETTEASEEESTEESEYESEEESTEESEDETTEDTSYDDSEESSYEE